jgi:hypothetical protein
MCFFEKMPYLKIFASLAYFLISEKASKFKMLTTVQRQKAIKNIGLFSFSDCYLSVGRIVESRKC